MQHKLEYIFNYYGLKNQILKLQEELIELEAEINKVLMDVSKGGTFFPEGDHLDMLDEIADVLVVCEQFKNAFPLIGEIMESKVNRTIERIGYETVS